MSDNLDAKRDGEAADRLLHPLDIPREIAPARAYFCTAMAMRMLASPAVLTAAVLVLLTVSNNVWTPIIGPAVALSLVCYTEQRFRADAWAYIARREQDPTRHDPARWTHRSLLAQILLVGAATWLFIARSDNDLPPTARVLAIGVLGGLILVEVAELAEMRYRPGHRGVSGAFLRSHAIQKVAIIGIAGFGVTLLAPWQSENLWKAGAGVLVPVLAAVAWWLLRRIPEHVRCLPDSLIPS
ncbi:hypothetical protein [Changpingibacter yushuensis]|uniref:hypothetical protein n=1 Tax=Changpingibacter yushuensis TaxID=2758440 RepID=UPI00165E7884|nr:hypothetical protein [Changpingibacter yushuensis]